MNIPSKASSYTAFNAADLLKKMDAFIDCFNELETRLAAAERELFCMREQCDACPGRCDDCPAKGDDSE